ncbi:hypothetical protein RND71_018909 [Anisodus tanguticus]|uniref:SAM domain-containing protein n=1 Tax=Anisodus tanguticus TaxID=243964 RepID=A0AAE1VBF2_9SOLA|nr:hypothetical protein RND71_018909 [Anisodus tanguticus]
MLPAKFLRRSPSRRQVESVDSFLQALGLEKYAITFQAEEVCSFPLYCPFQTYKSFRIAPMPLLLFLQVDMAALVHMTDEDLKAMGIPMGPRKKILLALESKV